VATRGGQEPSDAPAGSRRGGRFATRSVMVRDFCSKAVADRSGSDGQVAARATKRQRKEGDSLSFARRAGGSPRSPDAHGAVEGELSLLDGCDRTRLRASVEESPARVLGAPNGARHVFTLRG
jgi:hypothetical protein